MFLKLIKPLIDFSLALVLLIILSPLLTLVALAIYLEDGAPVFFVHKRVGANGKVFNILKFRSMPASTELKASADGKDLTITKVGQIIRRLSIDELPQLINVLRLEMSLIGPRPGLESQVALHELRRTNKSNTLRPGITGLAQINGFDGMSDKKKVEWDGEYYETVSLIQDIKIIFGTLKYMSKPPPTY